MSRLQQEVGGRFHGGSINVRTERSDLDRALQESSHELVAAAGLDHPTQFSPAHFSRRVSPNEVKSFSELYPSLSPGELIAGTSDRRFETAWAMASAAEFRAVV